MPNNREIIPDTEILINYLKKAGLLQYFDGENIKRLNRGEPTSIINNVHYEGKVWDGTFQLIEDQDQAHILHFKKCKVEIEIPDKVHGKKLSSVEKSALMRGEAIGPFIIGNQEIYLHLDNVSNTIAVYSPNKIGIPDEIMGYKLSSFEKRLLDGGNTIGPKVFCADGHYFIGHFSVDKKDDLYMWKTHYDKELSKREALNLIPRYNESQKENEPEGLTELQKQIFFIPPPPERKALQNVPIPYYPFDNEAMGKELKNKDVSLYRNNTFNLITLNIKKNKGLPRELFKDTFSGEDITHLKNGETLHCRNFTFVSGDMVTGDILLKEFGEINRLTIQIKAQKKKGQESYTETDQKFNIGDLSHRDRQIMDSLDKRDVKSLNYLAENGVKPSWELRRLIYANSRLKDSDKRMVAAVFNIDPMPDNSLNKREVNGNRNNSSELLLTSGKTEKPKISRLGNNFSRSYNKRHIAMSLKNLFHDM